MKRLVLAAALALSPPAFAQVAPAAPDYAQESSWLCLPGRADVCSRPQETAELLPAGYGPMTQEASAPDAPIDCFYVYPTVSRDPGLNSDMVAGTEEQMAAAAQFARFAGICRPFAPVYRSATVSSIPAVLTGQDPAPIFATAYGDVLASWRHYLAHHNEGRPFVLIGHSQGTIHLTRLIASEIESRPEATRMVSALLIGFNVEVPEGRTVGGTFRSTPLCTRLGETGCVITYVSFRAEAPPPAAALFGRAGRPGHTVGCTNPAALGTAANVPLDSYWPAAGRAAIAWSSTGPPPAAFLRARNLVSAACVNDGPLGYLAVTVNADPADARTDRIPGDVEFLGAVQPGWGIHPADVSLALGDLVRAVRAQRDAFLAARR
jgi:hypothetical protein